MKHLIYLFFHLLLLVFSVCKCPQKGRKSTKMAHNKDQEGSWFAFIHFKLVFLGLKMQITFIFRPFSSLSFSSMFISLSLFVIHLMLIFCLFPNQREEEREKMSRSASLFLFLSLSLSMSDFLCATCFNFLTYTFNVWGEKFLKGSTLRVNHKQK